MSYIKIIIYILFTLNNINLTTTLSECITSSTKSSYLSIITTMFALILVVTQILFLAFVGGFARTTQTFTQSYYLSTNILFLLAWTLMNSPFKKLTLTSLTILILTIALTVQCNLLFGRFWYNVFNQFTVSYQLTIEIFIQCTVAVFVILLITIDYIGIFRYWQIYMLIVPIVNFIWTFNHAILRYGLKIFDGGCGMDGFLFSGVVTLTLWAFAVRAKHNRYGGYIKDSQNISMKQNMYKRQEYYNGYSISLFGGLIGTFILWPLFNSSLATLSSKLSIVNTSILSSPIFANSAYSNTILALSIGTVLSFTLSARNGTHEQKQKIRSVIDCFINSGIICASFIDISLNPAAVMTMALLASILTLILYWYYQSLDMKQGKTAVVSSFMILVLYFSRAIFRVLLTLIGCIVAAIVVSNRQSSQIPLLNTTTYGSTIYAKTAGLEIAGYFVTFGLSLIAGVLCGLAVNLFHSYKQNQAQKLQKTTETQQKNTPQKKPLEQNQLIHVQPFGSSQQNTPNILTKPNLQKFKQTQLTDYSFLEFGQLDSQIFPLFHSQNDTYNDQQQLARKMLKQVMLSHIKNNQISTNNYISINKNKNTLTNNTNNTIQQKPPSKSNRPKALQIQNQYIFKNDHDSAKKIQYTNRLGQTPKSGKSQIKNQTKQIVELVNRDREIQFKKQKSIERQPMPQFYIDHKYKKNKTQNNSQRNSQINIKPNPPIITQANPQINPQINTQINPQMNRSNTQKYIKPASIKKANINPAPQPQPIKPTTNILRNNQLKKTKSQSFINLPQSLQSKKQKNIQIPIISQHQKQQQQYRSKNINKSNNNNNKPIPTTNTNINNNNNISISRKLDFSQPLKLTTSSYQNKKQIKQIIKDDGSQILSQNQHISQENQNSQII